MTKEQIRSALKEKGVETTGKEKKEELLSMLAKAKETSSHLPNQNYEGE